MARSSWKRRYGKKKYRRNPDAGGGGGGSGPPLFAELAEFVGPAFGGFALTRFATRILATQVAKKKPSLGKHAGAIASVGAFLAAWLLAHKWKWLAKYQMPLVVGSGLAALQSLIQLYVPKLGWTVSDATPELAGAGMTAQQLSAKQNNLTFLDENPDYYTYNDSFDTGRMGTTQTQANNAATAQDATDDDLLADLDLEETAGAQNMGIFSN
jgi:hypothetical protein